MSFDLIIRGAKVVTAGGVVDLEIGIEGEKIAALAASISGGASEEFVADGLHVFPGLIDAHVHFNEPGRTDWEGFDTGSAALVAGGGTCFFDMPLNASPPTLDGASFDLKLNAALASSRADFALWGGLTPSNLSEMESPAERGVVGFKAFMSNSGIEDFSRADDFTLYRGMQKAAALGLVVAVHAENEELTARLSAEIRSTGGTAVRDYLDSRPIVAEVDAIRRAISFAHDAGCKLHIVHISSAAGVMEVVTARKAGVDVTAETCPHYLSLTDADCERLGASAKCAPPLRNSVEVEKLWDAISRDMFDIVGSDHSPAPASMKTDKDFFKIWGGISGVQSTLSLLVSRADKLSAQQIAKLTATNVAKRFDIGSKGKIEVGMDADLAIVDVGREYELKREMLFDRHKLSPYVGRQMRGLVRRTMVRGNTVFADGKLTGQFRGSLVRPEARVNA